MERKIENKADDGAINLYKLGDVKLAEIHSSANEPLRKLNEPDRNCDFYPCCNYLLKKKII